MKMPKTTRIGMRDHPQVKSPITPNKLSMNVTVAPSLFANALSGLSAHAAE